MVLTCVGFISCDDKNDEPQITNELNGCWCCDDGVMEEKYEFNNSGNVNYTCSAEDPFYFEQMWGRYRYDESSGFLQLFWSDNTVDR